ncbi:hypothetical protein M3Y96_00514700 [Aphelenchoides besseyi]|nr:hypothetical protein M3Y96_00514700 [Aphelenchoides besseyi]
MDLIVKKELIDEINQLEIKQEEDFDRGPTMHFTSFPPSATMKVSQIGVQVVHGATHFFYHSEFGYDPLT